MSSSWTGLRAASAPVARTRGARSAFAWLHRWVGLTLGLVLAVMGTTGALMAFRPELQDAFAPRIALAAAQRLPLDALVARLEAAAGPGQVLRMLA
ncbi:MAG TPA: PepSY-associated TM helix domain-containing protein, partial [Xanthomonadales bacterium]|nr:PepSY-associated TM helix domain-containing protein [Xanthomonadales bacterium]